MKRELGMLAAVVVGTSLGCTPAIIPIGSHVTKNAPETTVDDVWVLHGGILKRCSNTPQGPVCVAVQQR